MYDAAVSILAQKLSQVEGVGQVIVGGSSLPAVRVERESARRSNSFGIGLDAGPRPCWQHANANRPKGQLADERTTRWQLDTTDQLLQGRRVPAADRRLPQRRAGAACPTSPTSTDSVRGRPQRRACRTASRRCMIDHLPPARRQHHRHRRPRRGAAAGACRRRFPPAIDVGIVHGPHHHDPRLGATTWSSRCCISIVLVVLVVFVFLRNVRATFIPSVAVPLSLIGTFGVMYLVRLQPRQSLADGADHLHGIRGGRRHRGDRKHHAPPGSRA